MGESGGVRLSPDAADGVALVSKRCLWYAQGGRARGKRRLGVCIGCGTAVASLLSHWEGECGVVFIGTGGGAGSSKPRGQDLPSAVAPGGVGALVQFAGDCDVLGEYVYLLALTGIVNTCIWQHLNNGGSSQRGALTRVRMGAGCYGDLHVTQNLGVGVPVKPVTAYSDAVPGPDAEYGLEAAAPEEGMLAWRLCRGVGVEGLTFLKCVDRAKQDEWADGNMGPSVSEFLDGDILGLLTDSLLSTEALGTGSTVTDVSGTNQSMGIGRYQIFMDPRNERMNELMLHMAARVAQMMGWDKHYSTYASGMPQLLMAMPGATVQRLHGDQWGPSVAVHLLLTGAGDAHSTRIVCAGCCEALRAELPDGSVQATPGCPVCKGYGFVLRSRPGAMMVSRGEQIHGGNWLPLNCGPTLRFFMILVPLAWAGCRTLQKDMYASVIPAHGVMDSATTAAGYTVTVPNFDEATPPAAVVEGRPLSTVINLTDHSVQSWTSKYTFSPQDRCQRLWCQVQSAHPVEAAELLENAAVLANGASWDLDLPAWRALLSFQEGRSG